MILGAEGVVGIRTLDYSGDFDDAPENKTVFVASTSPANAPTTGSLTYRGILTTYFKGGYSAQIYIDCYVSYKMFFRVSSAGGSWQSWKSITMS